MIDFIKIEKKWQKKWESKKVFAANIDKKRKKFFTSNVVPYVNGDLHIGHTYTYTRTDVYARFKRMQGFNVLLAQGFHATGEPIVGTVERLKKNDMSQIETYKMFGASDKDIEDFKKKGPVYVANFWSKKMAETLKMMGFSIDWRRRFALSIDPQFSKFVQWQYNTLRKKGYVVQGTHPVVWCPHDQSPTGDHDRLEGEGESPVEYVLIKFRLGDAFLPAATLRPETVYGVTNIWLNPHADYVKIEVNGKKWIVAKEAVIKVKDQFRNVKELKEYDERIELFGKRARNPVTNNEISILPSDFVDPGNATGVVMSVPAHAPYDYIALEEFKAKGDAERFGIAKEELEPVSVVKSELGEIPAKTVCEKMKITSIKQIEDLDEATSAVYKKEFHSGVLNDKCGPYYGTKVSEVKSRIVEDFVEKNVSNILYDVKNVVCRCTTKCHVKILENQWFLKYSDEKWKNLVRRCLEGMDIYPNEARNNFLATIDWLNDKACTRKSGLGTPLPWDKKWIIETLSDSTIYMAYYTIAGIINKHKIPASKLDDEVFDCVFFGKGNQKQVAKKSGIRLPLLTAMRDEFNYFYPVDFRNSGKDLLQHHLTFYLYQHTALWPENKWPRIIAVNGYVNVEGEKMSKSKGNIIPLRTLIENYGADLTRINIAASSEGIDDADWRAENINAFRIRYELLFDLIKNIKKSRQTKTRPIDLYLLSRMQKIIKNATENFEVTKFRTVANYAFFDAHNELKWYLTRTGGIGNANRKVLAETLSIVIRLLSPFTPHICEEMWSVLGNKPFASLEKWPKYEEKKIDEKVEMGEALVKSALDDIREIQKLKKMKPKTVKIFIAEDWKFSVYNIVIKNKGKSINEMTKNIMSGDLKKYGNATVGFIQGLYKKINEINPVLDKKMQISYLNESKDFLEKEIGCKIEIIDANNSGDIKAKTSMPNRPGILLE